MTTLAALSAIVDFYPSLSRVSCSPESAPENTRPVSSSLHCPVPLPTGWSLEMATGLPSLSSSARWSNTVPKSSCDVPGGI
uniref:Uncharacterized protein n=1 Tax=Bracon brevicornis TaxID=1563983 RepID=A0A6V7LLZ8_9HYME